MTSFDEATALAPTTTAGRWAAEVAPSWSIGGRTNGGYLLALAAAGALAELAGLTGAGHPHPLAVTGAFTTSAPAGPTDVDAAVLRAGRGSSVVRVTTSARGETSVEALVTCGALPPAGPPHHDAVPPPAVPPLADCRRLDPDGLGFHVGLLTELDEHADPATLGWAVGRPSGRAELRAWVTFADGRAWDPLALVMAADCLPPATFDLGLTGWVPTLQMTVLVRGVPAPGPVLVRQVARLVSAGSGSGGRSATVDETCDVWDSAGALVATGHQLAALRLPG